MVSSGLFVSPWPFLSTGQRVLIEKGPLAGVEGLLVSIKKIFRLVVSVNMLQRSISVEVDREAVRPL
jgi:transcription antitermination factor NusG